MLRPLGLLFLLILALPPPALALPPGFVQEAVGSGWQEVAGVTFDSNDRLYAWERGGRVWIVENGVKHSTPLIDLRDEVGGWRDFGLLGFALHPNFAQNGFIYLFYVVDRHHLLYAGTEDYDPNADEYFSATIGRIVRYTALAADDFNSVDPASRVVLAGATPNDGCPILYESHGTGSLVFGTDATLIAACGDGASYSSVDVGSRAETYYLQALQDGIISAKENVGAYRAQLVDSLSGKLWRIDPRTGAGVPSNPFYDPENPNSKASRVWALGVRNPYRMTLRPGTGSHDPLDADPGVVYVGDVGWGTWEDLHVVKQGGRNLGWPAFEGLDVLGSYFASNVSNLDAPNPLYNGTTCTNPYFYFRELIQQDTLTPSPFFPNPCGGAITTSPTFVHQAPEVDWRHGAPGPARSKVYDGEVMTPVTIGANGSPVEGASFGGNASTGGVWYTGSQFPAAYQNTYFHADYGAGWIRNFGFDANDQPTRVDLFHSGADGVVHVAANPATGDLYYVSWASVVRRVRWVGLGSEPPVAVASASASFGPTPFPVQFTGDASSDPEGFPLEYLWDFGDGTTSTEASPAHVFAAEEDTPTRFTVTLTVTDATTLTALATVPIWLENTPPQVAIESPPDGALYALDAPTTFPLLATFSDDEHVAGLLTCAWQTSLHHNNHVHSEPVDPSCSSSTVLSPIGCDGNAYFYSVSLTITDPLGLASSDTVAILPDCPNVAPISAPDSASVSRGYSIAIHVLANDADPVGAIDPGGVEITTPPLHGTAAVDSGSGVVTYTHDGSQHAADAFSYRVSDEEGLLSNVALVSIHATNEAPQVAITSPANLSTFTEGTVWNLQAAGSDVEDGIPPGFHWEIQRIENGALIPGVFVWDGRFPPAFSVPSPALPADHVSYLVKVTVTDLVGATASDQVRLVPASPSANQPPVASFTRNPESGTVPLAVTLDASASSDPDGDYLLYHWSFGDGATATGPIASHTYLGVAQWSAVLTVTDAVGATGQASEVVTAEPSGLQGDYYDNLNFTNLVLTRSDPVVDFNWGAGSPAPGIGVDTFSVRWTGRILPEFSETYTFYTTSDDGIRLWIDDVLLIDHWTIHAASERSGTIALDGGELYALRMEYYENGASATARLSWSSPSRPKQIIPIGRLFAPGAVGHPPIAVEDVRTLVHGGSAAIAVLANDLHADAALDPNSVVVASAPAHGTTSVDPVSGVVTYAHTGTSAETFDSFDYTVEDDNGAVSAPATVWIALVPPPQVSISSPTPGENLAGATATLAYSIVGYLPFVGGARFRLDDGAWTTETVLSGSFGWSGISFGPHTLSVELLSSNLVPLANPGASAQVSINAGLDADGDAVDDESDNCPGVANPGQDDADSDGRGDLCDNCPAAGNPAQANADGDALGDICDVCPSDPANDVDGDGVCADADNCPGVANPGQDDADSDAHGDLCDNCPAVGNPGQANVDADLSGDACDVCPSDAANDVDGDGVCAEVDNCAAVPNPAQTNGDGDLLGDACDVCPSDAANDIDGDGVCADADNCPNVANDQSDLGGPGSSGPDGIGDACQCGDLDADGDADSDDIVRLRDFLADPSGAELSATALLHCSVIGDAASCDVQDVAALARASASLEPGLAQSCIAALP